MNDIEKLKAMASPSSERIAIAVEALLAEQVKTNKYKEEQKQGDIKFRKSSTKTSLLGIGIALMALYISITGNDLFVASCQFDQCTIVTGIQTLLGVSDSF